MSISDLTPALGSDTRLKLADGRRMLLDVPDEDYDEFMRDVREVERVRVRELLVCFREMLAARSLKIGAQGAAARRSHYGWGWSAKSLLNLFRVYREGGYRPGDVRKLGAWYKPGDWRVLLREYKGFEPLLPPEFRMWLGEQFAQFRGRRDCMRALWDHVVRELWLKGAPVPGYGTIDDWCMRTGRARPNPLLIRPGELPAGWSEDTFRRALPRRQSVREQMAGGYLAAHRYHPDQVLTDRGPLRPLEYVFLDDNRPDLRCLYLSGGRGEIVYPLLLLGLDGASAVDVANVAKPRALKAPEAEDAAERKARMGVSRAMTDLVVIRTLRWGLPQDYPVTFVHEKSGACPSDDLRHALRNVYGDRIRFESSEIVTQRFVEWGFAESGGAPYVKAPLESFWRVLMTHIARLPGSTGPRYDTQPPELKDIERYQLALVEQAGGLAEIVEQLRNPLLRFEQAHDAIERVLRLLRFRTVHALQGFEKVQEWRRSPAHGYEPIATLGQLSADEQAALASNGDKHAIIDRLECPAERFVRLFRGVATTPVDDDLLTYLEAGASEARFRATVRDGKITVRRAEIDDPAGAVFREIDHPLLDEDAEGRSYDAALSSDGTRIVLADEGRILGGVARQGRVCRSDTEALRREMGRVRAARASDRERFAGYYLTDTHTALLEMRQQNAAVIASAPALKAAEPAAQPRIAAARRQARNLNAQLAEIARQNAMQTGGEETT